MSPSSYKIQMHFLDDVLYLTVFNNFIAYQFLHITLIQMYKASTQNSPWGNFRENET